MPDKLAILFASAYFNTHVESLNGISLISMTSSGFASCPDDARVAPRIVELHDQIDIVAGSQPLAPFDDRHSVTAQKVLQSDGTQVALAAQTIEIYMINRTPSLVNIYDRK
jgi:hypothetical protein